jgi:hypothetical protein
VSQTENREHHAPTNRSDLLRRGHPRRWLINFAPDLKTPIANPRCFSESAVGSTHARGMDDGLPTPKDRKRDNWPNPSNAVAADRSRDEPCGESQPRTVPIGQPARGNLQRCVRPEERRTRPTSILTSQVEESLESIIGQGDG